MTYLDHAGATLYAKSQLDSYIADLSTHLYGNPHSQSPSSLQTEAAVDHSRNSVLRFFGTDSSRYDVVFTSGCTGALKLLSECFPWYQCHRCRGHTSQYPSNIPPVDIASGNGVNHTERCPQEVKSNNDSDIGRPLLKEGEKEISVHGPHGGEEEEVWRPKKVNVVYTRDSKGSEVRGRGSGECGGRSIFCYLEDNHTSVVGMREMAAQFGASIVCATPEDITSSDLQDGTATLESRSTQNAPNPPIASGQKQQIFDEGKIFDLFVYPAQSNFSGHKYPLTWAVDIPNGHLSIAGLHSPTHANCPPRRWTVCLDAASYVGTSPLDLSENPVDFLTLSFYKIFGFPTGLGALMVRKDCARILEKSYFGGGTVASTMSRTGLHVPRAHLHERWVN